MKHYSDLISERLTARHYKSVDLCNFKDKRILDIGCSYGWFEKFALDNNCKEIIAIDPRAEAIAFSRSHFSDKRVKFIKASASNIKRFKNDSFDLIVCFEVLEHIPKNTEFELFKQVKRILRKGGMFVLSTPFKNFFSCFLDPAWYFGHRHYSSKDLINFINYSGLKSHLFETYGGFWELSSMILLYIFKWVFRSEIPFKSFFEKKRDEEYSKTGGFATIFIEAVK